MDVLRFEFVFAKHGIKGVVVPGCYGRNDIFQNIDNEKTGKERNEEHKGNFSAGMTVYDRDGERGEVYDLTGNFKPEGLVFIFRYA